jgi:hypothetical protein
VIHPSASGSIAGEHGYWDYTCPESGGLEHYTEQDYRELFEDMANAGMNSMLFMIKWWTTGYRSRLPYLDQLPGNPTIESDNDRLRFAIAEARARGMKVWLGAVVTFFEAARFTSEPNRLIWDVRGYRFPFQVGTYDSDAPEIRQRSVEILEEIVELFPDVDGLLIEVEHAGREKPHRIPLYDAWAAERGRPSFAELKAQPWDILRLDQPDWRAYATDARAAILGDIERAVRTSGFKGQLATICESFAQDYVITHEVDLVRYRERFPDWGMVFYDYAKWRHRYANMDFLVDQPNRLGINGYYLARGVMTDRWNPWPMPVTLREHWTMDVEDIRQFRPRNVWWYGSGTVSEGANTALSDLAMEGYRTGREARQAMLDIVRGL